MDEDDWLLDEAALPPQRTNKKLLGRAGILAIARLDPAQRGALAIVAAMTYGKARRIVDSHDRPIWERTAAFRRMTHATAVYDECFRWPITIDDPSTGGAAPFATT